MGEPGVALDSVPTPTTATARDAARDTGRSSDTSPKRRRRVRWRRWLRAIHRDVGYLCVGLTVVYALSGIAVNHIDDWDPNFTHFEQTVELGGPLAGSDDAITSRILLELQIEDSPIDVYRAGDELTITLPRGRQVHADTKHGKLIDEGQRSRFLLRTSNWLHLNRGKDAWTYVADIYAGFLLLLALSGMFMLGGRKGLIGRGGVLVLAGVGVPVVYVLLSGGPT